MSIPALSQMTVADQNALLLKLLEMLVNPPSVEPGTARVRQSVEAFAAGVALPAVTSLTQIAGFDAKQSLLNALENDLWANAVRRNIT